MRDVSIVIPTWNASNLLAEYLPSVIAAARQCRDVSSSDVELIVVDDGSTDDTTRVCEALFSDNPVSARVLRLDRNSGFVAAANAGFAAARFETILLLNNDVRVERDAIAPLVAHFDDKLVFAVCAKAMRLGTEYLDGGGKLGLFERGFWRVYLNYDVIGDNNGDRRWPSFFGSGGYTAYSASKLKALGGFNELLAPAYWEDVEICYRAWKRGWVVEYEPSSLVHHVSSATMKDPALHRRMKIVSERNRILTIWMNLHDTGWFARHLLWLGLKLIAAALSLDIVFCRGFMQALRTLSKAGVFRRRERKAVVRSDREVDSIFRQLAVSGEVRVLKNVREYLKDSSTENIQAGTAGSASARSSPR